MSGEQQWRCEQAPMIPDCHKPVEMGKGEECLRREIARSTREVVEESIAASKTDEPWPGEGEGPYSYNGGCIYEGKSLAAECGTLMGGMWIAQRLNRLAGEVRHSFDIVSDLENQLAAANERVRELEEAGLRIITAQLSLNDYWNQHANPPAKELQSRQDALDQSIADLHAVMCKKDGDAR